MRRPIGQYTTKEIDEIHFFGNEMMLIFKIISDVYGHVDINPGELLYILSALKSGVYSTNMPDITSVSFDLKLPFGKTKRLLQKLEAGGVVTLTKQSRSIIISPGPRSKDLNRKLMDRLAQDSVLFK